MADKKISQLNASTTPLAGTEVLPIVQSGVTKQVSVANLTAGRAVSMSDVTYTGMLTGGTGVFNLGSGQFYKGASGDIGIGSTSPSFTAGSGVMIERAVAPCISFKETGGTAFDIFNIFGSGIIANRSANPINVEINGVTHSTFVANGDFSVATGNVYIGTSGKGIDFSATGQAAGMTSELLDDYEEGTWTPTQGAGLTVVGAFSAAGKYTKVGNLVTISAQLIGETSVAIIAGTVLLGGLPFTNSSTIMVGTIGNYNANAAGGVYVGSNTTSMYCLTTFGATKELYVTMNYFV